MFVLKTFEDMGQSIETDMGHAVCSRWEHAAGSSVDTGHLGASRLIDL